MQTVIKGRPCVQFVPDFEKDTGKKLQTFQLKIGCGKANYTKFDSQTCKDALRHIPKYRQVSKKLGQCKQYNKTCDE